jgi:superfamily II DNA or RNA helicase
MAEAANCAGSNSFLLIAECGAGKTYMSIALSCQLQRKTLVLVHKSDLYEQWISSYRKFTTANVGMMKGSVLQSDNRDVVIAMVQTITTGKHDDRVVTTPDGAEIPFYDQFGFVIVDECHHSPAEKMSQALRRFSAKTVIGVTATPNRNDGLPLCPIFGLPVAELKHCFSDLPPWKRLHVRVVSVESGKAKMIRDRRDRIILARMITSLCKDEQRNDMLVRLVKYYAAQDRHIIVLSERRKHLELLMKLYEQERTASLPDSGLYVGVTSKKGLQAREKAKHKRVLFATIKMCEEGFDKARLDTLIWASPKKTIQQAVGRIERVHPDKQAPLVVDIVDEYVPTFKNMARRRMSLYRSRQATFVD